MSGNSGDRRIVPEREPDQVPGVRKVATPPEVRARSTLSRVDYEDTFLVRIEPPSDRTAEQWARTMLEGAPKTTRHMLTAGWTALGLRLASTRSTASVLGWTVRQRRPDVLLLGADGRLGLSGELLFERVGDDLLRFATFVRLDNTVARHTWAAITPRHVETVQDLLVRIARSDRRPLEQTGRPG